MTTVGRRARAWLWCSAMLFACAGQARAQDVPFAFLIQNGWQALQQPVARLDQPLVSWARRSTFYAVTNGAKGGALGAARVIVWSRSVADPLYAAIGPVAGIITLEFPTFHGHLGLIDAPAGLQTTIGIIESSGAINIGVTGQWALGDGTSVVGGTASDLVVTGIVRFRAVPATIGAVALAATPPLPTVPFAFDASPSGSPNTTQAGTLLGNYYALAQGPLRWYRRSDTLFTGLFDDASLMVMSLGGGSYVVMVCAEVVTSGSPAFQRCTVSGTGPMLAPVTGHMPTYSLGTLGAVTLHLQLWFAP